MATALPDADHDRRLGARTLALAGRLGDGLLLPAGLSVSELAAAVAAAREGGQAPGTEVVHSLVAATGPDAQARVDADLAQWGVSPDPSRTAAGDAETVATAIRRCADAGATTVVALPTTDLTDVRGLVEFLGREVRPLLG